MVSHCERSDRLLGDSQGTAGTYASTESMKGLLGRTVGAWSVSDTWTSFDTLAGVITHLDVPILAVLARTRRLTRIDHSCDKGAGKIWRMWRPEPDVR